jgi:hypothetical protein
MNHAWEIWENDTNFRYEGTQEENFGKPRSVWNDIKTDFKSIRGEGV